MVSKITGGVKTQEVPAVNRPAMASWPERVRFWRNNGASVSYETFRPRPAILQCPTLEITVRAPATNN